MKINKSYSNKIKPLVSKIVDKYHPDKVYLFGSYAWGKPTADSDVDLFVVKEDVDKSQRKRRRKLRALLFGGGVPFDLFVYTPSEVDERLELGDFFIRNIIEKRKVLYDRKSV